MNVCDEVKFVCKEKVYKINPQWAQSKCVTSILGDYSYIIFFYAIHVKPSVIVLLKQPVVCWIK